MGFVGSLAMVLQIRFNEPSVKFSAVAPSLVRW